jgi:2,4-dienoyl-CoA reductase-like NADH-dependent reductase (Old Yellow Enzyme family)
MSPSDILQSPFRLSPRHLLSHRIVLAPMTRMHASPTGIPTLELQSTILNELRPADC